ncbi:S8 family serine peptidase [Actinomycetes bacterium KLBMP 9797]
MATVDGDASIERRGGDIYVIPHEAVGHVRAGRVDEALFNVTDLVAEGYHDGARGTLPLLVTGQRAATLAADAGAARRRALPSIGAVAVTADKSRAGALWDELVAGPATLTTGVRRVWLDRTITAALDDSVPRIGAPAAWRSGYDGRGVTVAVLDSGYDPTHPALAGRVAAAANFTDEPDTVDRFGHGTHVAATVAGGGRDNGVAPGARDEAGIRPGSGVAPGARLLVGKVLDGAGQGDLSWVIAGMEWAVALGARVVNISLGGPAGEGGDPVSDAVDALTASSGALFVVASGNAGPDAHTVSTPGIADAALTVGAVSKEDELARFSGRGPRLGDAAVKPEITAPGVGIVAARAAGTMLGEPLDGTSTAMSGTSMATPHVAGAAAILAQRHPKWTARELKAALVASADPIKDAPVSAQGAGRLDVAAAIDQRVAAEPAALTLDGASTATVTYRNSGPKAVTLALAAGARDGGATPRPAALTVTPARLTVPAGGTATATVRLDHAATRPGLYSGLVTARGGGVVVRTPLSADVAPPEHLVSVTATNHAGGGPESWSNVLLWNLDTGDRFYAHFAGARTTSVRVPAGRYALTGILFGADDADATLVTEPQLRVDGDRTLRFDGRAATRLSVDTPRPSTVARLGVVWQRTAGPREFLEGNAFGGETAIYTLPSSSAATVGTFQLLSRWDSAGPDYRYDLLFTEEGRVPAGLRYAARQPDLATVESEFHGHGIGLLARDSRGGFVADVDVALAFGRDVRQPGVRTDYLNARGVTWRQEAVQERGDSFGALGLMHGLSRAYRAGERAREVWFGAVVRPALPDTPANYAYGAPVNRAHDAIRVAIPHYADGAVDRYGWLDYRSDAARLMLRRGDTEVGTTTLPYAQFTVPGGDARYRLTLDVTRDRFADGREWWTTSTATSTTWTFRSGRPRGDRVDVLPLLQIGYTVDTDLTNAVRAGAAYPLILDLGHQPGADRGGRIAADVRVSYDDGASWRRVPTAGGRRVTATVPAAPRGAQFATIRVIATDAAGNRIDQTITRAWRVSR